MTTEQEMEVRDDICGEVARAVLASAGEKCNARTTKEVVDQLNSIRGVRVDRWDDSIMDSTVDDRDFIDLTVTRASSSGEMFRTLTRNGFVPAALAGNWEGGTSGGEDGRVVLQFKR